MAENDGTRIKRIDLKRMCDHCYRMVGEDELYGFKIVDNDGYTRGMKGHEDCVKVMIETIEQLYGERNNKDE